MKEIATLGIGCLIALAVIVGGVFLASDFFINIGISVIAVFTAVSVPSVLSFIVGAFVSLICLTIVMKIFFGIFIPLFIAFIAFAGTFLD